MKRLATASLDTAVQLESPAATAAFTDDLTRAVADVLARHHSPGGGSRPDLRRLMLVGKADAVPNP